MIYSDDNLYALATTLLRNNYSREYCINYVKDKLLHEEITVTEDMLNGIQYNGSEKKFGVTYNGDKYIMKFKKKDYTNILSEHIASRFIRACGWKCHETLLATYKGEQIVLCKDFTDKCGRLRTISSISSSSIDTDATRHEYYFDEVEYLLRNTKHMSVEKAIYDFYIMYVFDTVLGNTDRHLGNWGICNKDGENSLSPIFDNGASLFPRNKIYTLPTKEWMTERVYTFPNSKIMFGHNRERSSYYKVWQSNAIPDNVREYAVKLPVVDAIEKVLKDINLSEEVKKYYSFIIECRYRGIILGEEDFYEKALRRYNGRDC